MIPQAVLDFRVKYRASEIPRHYSGLAHFCFISLVALGVIVFAILRVRRVTWLELLIVPATFLLSNYVEYRGHRGPMHHLTRWLGLHFTRHTVQHHQFFTYDAMSYEGLQDFKIVLFPSVMIFFFLGLQALPVAVLLYYLVSPNVAHLNLATGVSYYLAYEWLHCCYHVREDSWVSRFPFMQILRRHHTIHHNPALMNRYNFNTELEEPTPKRRACRITFPICGWLLGTAYTQP